MSDPEDPGGGATTIVEVLDEQDRAVDVGRLHALASAVLGAVGVPAAMLSVTLVTPARIAELKAEFFGRAAETDVLSFPIDDPSAPGPGPVVLGDVVMCPAVAERQARALGIAPHREMDMLLVHGILHLLGWDHQTPAQEIAMRDEERRVLSEAARGRVA